MTTSPPLPHPARAVTIRIVLEMYLDGSGKSDDPQCRFLTLAGVMAEETVWNEWAARWRKVLDEYGVEYSHMRELFQRDKGPFRDWDNERKRRFVRGLLQTLNFKDRMSMVCTSLTIDLDDYRKLARPDTKPAEGVCVDFCLSHFFAHPRFGHEIGEVVFDSGERFERYLTAGWTVHKSKSDSWASYYRIVKRPDMKNVLQIEAADLLAWAANRRYTQVSPDNFWRRVMDMSIIGMPRYHAIYGETELMKHPGFFEWRDGTSVRK